MPELNTLEYIDSTNYDNWATKIKNLYDVLFDLTNKSLASRRLRYAEIDIEVERKAGRIAPDEVFVPIHVIETNIRREQSAYIQFITQSPRAIILKDKQDPSLDLALLEEDLTEKIRFDGWQISSYANIDGMQMHGYGVMETVLDPNNPGNLGREYIQFGDLAFIADTRDLQKVEMIGRAYYFTKTKLDNLRKAKEDNEKWDEEQVKKMMSAEPNDEQSQIYSGTATINRSLYKVMKVMFKVKGQVMVAWCGPIHCNGWLRKPRPLFVGRRKISVKHTKVAQMINKAPQMLKSTVKAAAMKMFPGLTDEHIDQVAKGLPASDPEYETQYPCFLYPYLISENDTIACLKGRTFLDQDAQNAASSLLSSLLTKSRNSSGLYFAKDVSDPNDNFLLEKNIYFKRGALINGKVKEFQLNSPDPTAFQAITMLTAINQQETSQVNFAETNRQADSRKTAKAIEAAENQQAKLSSVQVTLYSVSLKKQFEYECGIIKSRVQAGLIEIQNPVVRQMYDREWTVKPSGDIDVIEKEKKLQMMMQAWSVVQNTGAAVPFLTDILQSAFPDSAAKYINAIQQQLQQQQSQQQQTLQQGIGIAKQVGEGIMDLSKHPEYFSETGRVHAFPVVQAAADKFKNIQQQIGGNGQQR